MAEITDQKRENRAAHWFAALIAAWSLASGVEAASRFPDYAEATGKDWLYNHAVEAKRYAGEPAEDTGVDVFYIYQTVVVEDDENTVNGACDLDNAMMRTNELSGAIAGWNVCGSVFGGLGRVYVPFYRQVTFPAALAIVDPSDVQSANDAYMDLMVTNGATYADVAASLDHYFKVLNPAAERPFILAGHSQGSALLRLAMERFFTQDDAHKRLLKNLVACYAVGYGVTAEWAADLEKKTAVDDFAGVHFATNATDAGVYLTWNTVQPGETKPSMLIPHGGSLAINPLSWRGDSAAVGRSGNPGGYDAQATRLRPGLCDARLESDGTLVCSTAGLDGCRMPALPGGPFGTRSLHNWDFRLYWESIRLNAIARARAHLGDPDWGPACAPYPEVTDGWHSPAVMTDFQTAGGWRSQSVMTDSQLGARCAAALAADGFPAEFAARLADAELYDSFTAWAIGKSLTPSALVDCNCALLAAAADAREAPPTNAVALAVDAFVPGKPMELTVSVSGSTLGSALDLKLLAAALTAEGASAIDGNFSAAAVETEIVSVDGLTATVRATAKSASDTFFLRLRAF